MGAWSDPRKLERWWGPPGYPATFEKHDLIQGGEATYFMTGPEGDRAGGLWRVTAVDPPNSLQFTDVFANADGTQDMEKWMDTDTLEELQQAIAQMDPLLDL